MAVGVDIAHAGRVKKSKDNRPLRVLLAEDSLPVRERIRSMIEEAGPVKIIGEAGTSADVLAILREQKPDAVVLALQLADGASRSIFSELKQHHPDCTVIVLSAFASPEFRTRCRELGADHFFEKSTEFERVPEVLASLRRAKGLSTPASDHPPS